MSAERGSLQGRLPRTCPMYLSSHVWQLASLSRDSYYMRLRLAYISSTPRRASAQPRAASIPAAVGNRMDPGLRQLSHPHARRRQPVLAALV